MGSVPSRVWGGWSSAAVVALMLSSVVVPAASGQECNGPLGLRSPGDLDVRFENETIPGARLRWTGIGRELGSCVNLTIGADLESRLLPALRGVYADDFDRRITFSLTGDGTVGDRTRDEVVLAMSNPHPNTAAGSLTGRINLSGRGGIFRLDLDGTGDATQTNEGIPAHLERTNVVNVVRNPNTGRFYAGIERLPVVVSDDGGQSWREPVISVVPPFREAIRTLLVSPNDPDLILVNPDKLGLWRSADGGVSWQRDAVVDGVAGAISTVDIGFMKYLRVVPEGGNPDDPSDRVNRLYLHIVNVGLVFSDDDGSTYERVRGLERPVTEINPINGLTTIDCDQTDSLRLREFPVRDIVVSPTQPGKIYVGVERWGVHLGDTVSGHQVWEQRNLGIVACRGNSERLLGERRTAERLVALPSPDGTEDILLAQTDQPAPPAGQEPDERSATNIFLSQDSGRSWSFAPLQTVLDPEVGEVTLRVTSLIADPRPSRPRGVVAGTATQGIWTINIESQEGVWVKADQQPVNPRVRSLLGLPDGTVVVGTAGAGVYRPGLEVDLDRVAALGSTGTRVPRLGLFLSLSGAGTLFGEERFDVTGQTFQAYAVWRGRDVDPATGEPIWELIGMYDRTNPEFCSPTACDEPDLVRITGCFADKRANCFVAPPVDADGGAWEFFDRDVFNGFTYFYAVSALDYGNTATVSPTNFNGDFTFSPRSAVESDPAALPYVDLDGGENYNLVRFQVNQEVAADLGNVFVVPNPLVRRAGWDVGENSSVRFVNVTDTSRVQIFTLAGDLVQALDNVVFDGTERGNIEWDTRNGEGEFVASGVYIYRIVDDNGNEVVDRFTVIR